jgi:hypothetical protein
VSIRGVNINIQGLGYRYSTRGKPTFSNLHAGVPARRGAGHHRPLRLRQVNAAAYHRRLNRPTEGTMHFDDKKIEGPSSRWVMMFQAPHLFPG